MVESERECPDILLQISASQAALKKVSKILLEDHIDNCFLDALKSSDYERQLDELKKALSSFL
jgi:DNA-binding FrmR family transcriptional regulator